MATDFRFPTPSTERRVWDPASFVMGVLAPFLADHGFRTGFDPETWDRLPVRVRGDEPTRADTVTFAQFCEITRAVVDALPMPEDAKTYQAWRGMRAFLGDHERGSASYLRTLWSEMRDNEDLPLDENLRVEVTWRRGLAAGPAASREAARRLRDDVDRFAREFLRDLEPGRYVASDLLADYQAAATVAEVATLGRNTFYGLLREVLDGRVRETRPHRCLTFTIAGLTFTIAEPTQQEESVLKSEDCIAEAAYRVIAGVLEGADVQEAMIGNSRAALIRRMTEESGGEAVQHQPAGVVSLDAARARRTA